MGEDSFRFQSKNTDDLKEKLDMFLNNANIRENVDININKVYNKILSEYNWDNIVQETIHLYNK